MDNNTESLIGIVGGLIFLAIFTGITVLLIASLWRIFTKAGQPGWAAIVPFYNTYIKLIISGKPGWWLVLMLVPIVNIVIGIIMVVGLARHFGKSGGFAVGMIFLPFIFYPLLAFGDAQYDPNAN